MTNSEKIGIALGVISSIASIIAASASVAERLEKRRNREALNLSRDEECILALAANQASLRIEAGSYGSDILLLPAKDSRFLKIKSEAPLHRLVATGFLEEFERIHSKNHGPTQAPGSMNYVRVIIYQLTPAGRIRAREIPGSILESSLVAIQGF